MFTPSSDSFSFPFFFFFPPPSKAPFSLYGRGRSCREWRVFDASCLWNLSCFIPLRGCSLPSSLGRRRTFLLLQTTSETSCNSLKISCVIGKITVPSSRTFRVSGDDFALVCGCSVINPAKNYTYLILSWICLGDTGTRCSLYSRYIQHKRFKLNTSQSFPIIADQCCVWRNPRFSCDYWMCNVVTSSQGKLSASDEKSFHPGGVRGVRVKKKKRYLWTRLYCDTLLFGVFFSQCDVPTCLQRPQSTYFTVNVVFLVRFSHNKGFFLKPTLNNHVLKITC